MSGSQCCPVKQQISRPVNPKITEEHRKVAQEWLEKITKVFSITTKEPPFYQEKQTEQDREDQRLVIQILKSDGMVTPLASLLASREAQAAHDAASACVKAVEWRASNGMAQTILVQSLLEAIRSAAEPYLKRD